MAEQTVDTVAERFAESAETARRLPLVRVQGYFNLWGYPAPAMGDMGRI